ncbi:HET-domain-containing protein [Eremomyces bilateralis CBS 781.70]|uniref:HET-domain-containing protein n=1 Tax=Eremomyces bilateralis CBS 781.70 TaxID=1392243 RepID=A0A6G1G7B8_9PEZI|nr:HET-domain-containing protein [Eremomyces bilateralis CBS 781.70]KAF1813985.1 HET-domain-containing protein [Eremomyces bilateralis CBS 781.70]
MHTFGPESMSWVDSHLKTCVAEHNNCICEDSPLLPTRVLHIQPREGINGNLHVCLHQSLPNERGEYGCLSHCWGTEDLGHLCLSHRNITSFKTEIPWSDIPKTFQESIQLAHNLGLEYLWIDSLCIIQDDSQDWQTESGKMCFVYQNSYLTIAATSAPDGTGGLFHTTDVDHQGYELTIGDNNNSGSSSLYVRRSLPHRIFENARTMQHVEKQGYPLLTRGWALQERLCRTSAVYLVIPFCTLRKPGYIYPAMYPTFTQYKHLTASEQVSYCFRD